MNATGLVFKENIVGNIDSVLDNMEYKILSKNKMLFKEYATTPHDCIDVVCTNKGTVVLTSPIYFDKLSSLNNGEVLEFILDSVSMTFLLKVKNDGKVSREIMESEEEIYLSKGKKLPFEKAGMSTEAKIDYIINEFCGHTYYNINDNIEILRFTLEVPKMDGIQFDLISLDTLCDQLNLNLKPDIASRNVINLEYENKNKRVTYGHKFGSGEFYNLNGEIKSIQWKEWKMKNRKLEKGLPAADRYFEFDINGYVTLWMNGSGNKVYYRSYKDFLISKRYANGEIIELNEYDQFNRLVYSEKMKNGQMVKSQIEYEKKDDLEFTQGLYGRTKIYKNGQLIEVNDYKRFKSTYSYHPNGVLKEEVAIYDKKETTTICNSSGLIMSKKILDHNDEGRVISYRENQYQMNCFNEVVLKREIYSNQFSKGVVIDLFDFNEYGLCIASKIVEKKDSKIIIMDEFEYNEHLDPISKHKYKAYDKFGNWIVRDNYYGKRRVGQTIREIEYYN